MAPADGGGALALRCEGPGAGFVDVDAVLGVREALGPVGGFEVVGVSGGLSLSLSLSFSFSLSFLLLSDFKAVEVALAEDGLSVELEEVASLLARCALLSLGKRPKSRCSIRAAALAFPRSRSFFGVGG